MRRQFVESCKEMLELDSKSVVILGDIGVFGFSRVSAEYSGRVINTGILEQAMLGVGAGLSSVGCIPTIHTIAPFIVERAFEQIKVDFAYQGLPGNFVSVGASFDYSGLGCTHHCPADVGLLSHIPGMNIFVPGHPLEFKYHFSINWNVGSLNYFRLSESSNLTPIPFLGNETSLKIKQGRRGIVVVVGPMLRPTLDAVSDLDLEIHYVNHFKAGEKVRLNSEIRNAPLFLIEPYYSGRLLSDLLDTSSNWRLRVKQIGVPVTFLRGYGSYEDQLEAAGLDQTSIRRNILEDLG